VLQQQARPAERQYVDDELKKAACRKGGRSSKESPFKRHRRLRNPQRNFGQNGSSPNSKKAVRRVHLLGPSVFLCKVVETQMAKAGNYFNELHRAWQRRRAGHGIRGLRTEWRMFASAQCRRELKKILANTLSRTGRYSLP